MLLYPFNSLSVSFSCHLLFFTPFFFLLYHAPVPSPLNNTPNTTNLFYSSSLDSKRLPPSPSYIHPPFIFISPSLLPRSTFSLLLSLDLVPRFYYYFPLTRCVSVSPLDFSHSINKILSLTTLPLNSSYLYSLLYPTTLTDHTAGHVLLLLTQLALVWPASHASLPAISTTPTTRPATTISTAATAAAIPAATTTHPELGCLVAQCTCQCLGLSLALIPVARPNLWST